MQPSERLHSQQEFRGTIESVRAVEDCIRLTGKYTKGLIIEPARTDIQGAAFPSKVLREMYEVYPTLESGLGLGMDFALFVGIITTIAPDPVQVLFWYDYRTGLASVFVKGGQPDLEQLSKGISGFKDALASVKDSTVEYPVGKTVAPAVAVTTGQVRRATA